VFDQGRLIEVGSFARLRDGDDPRLWRLVAVSAL
jgi:hypothetical protein